ncbi:MAG: Serine aminopeptidase [Mycobacterium sp.]|jgi:pimeloyl-ACP methyl ester carboxylesterase|uniref:hypothetical protein n=1 Tax=Mycobacterium sp. TaxID=1785 RepID=UPI00262AAD68|nr:hypothetical protein [Mycobacterium sp.]MCW2662380.1 Serine aminopeptidase [Mycobacterium sp.]
MTHVELPAADRITPIDANARIITETAAGLPIVEYQHISMAARSTRLPTVLCMAGGGFSGAVYALLAEICAARGIRVVGFDMPGHTPVGLLGSATPSRALISRANTAVRAAAVNTMVARWRPRSARLDVLSHSAGFTDIARMDPSLAVRCGRFLICGAPIPGIAAMVGAARATSLGQSPEPVSLSAVLGQRVVPTGKTSDHFAGASQRLTEDRSLARYQCPEHISVVLALMTDRVVRQHDWRERKVVLIGSVGDAIAPPARIRAAADRLRSWGASVDTEILADPLPHLFLVFQNAATRIADIAADVAN